jgi:type II secretory pathway component PulK
MKVIGSCLGKGLFGQVSVKVRVMHLEHLKNRRHQRASVLILVLIVITSMTILAVGLAYRTRLEIRLAHADAQRTKVYYLALGGIERAKALLSQQELSNANVARICQFNGTAEEEGLFAQLKDCDLQDGTLLAYCLRDEQGYLNVNKSDSASWEKIDLVDKQCRASILDWIDADDDTSPDGAETDFYERLEPPYISKNGSFIALKELLFARTVTPEGYIGKGFIQDSPTGAKRTGKKLQFPPDAGEDITDLGLVNVFTVYGNGKININTAPRIILSALPGLDDKVGDTILTYRAGPDGQLGTDDDMCVEDAAKIANIEGLTEIQIELLQQYCCFGSEYFRIFSYAVSNNTFECCLMATVKMMEGQPQVICLERLL